jgi:hypothetical protein
VTASRKLGFKPGIDHAQGIIRIKNPCAKAEDIGVIMFSTQFRRLDIKTVRRSDISVSVCRDRHADTGTAHQDPPLAIASQHARYRFIGKIGIIYRVTGITANVKDIATGLQKILFDYLLQGKAAMVGSEDNFHFFLQRELTHRTFSLQQLHSSRQIQKNSTEQHEYSSFLRR